MKELTAKPFIKTEPKGTNPFWLLVSIIFYKLTSCLRRGSKESEANPPQAQEFVEFPVVHCWPGGNDTYLCVNPGAVSNDSFSLVDSFLRNEFPVFEQGGFLEKPQSGGAIRLTMAGGEFCGNAVRSAAAFLAHEYLNSLERTDLAAISDFDGIETHDFSSLAFQMEASGTDQLLNVTTTASEEEIYVKNDVPLPSGTFIRKETLVFENRPHTVWVVSLEGITHVLLDHCMHPWFNKSSSRDFLRRAQNQFELNDRAAIGLILFQQKEDENHWAIDPVIFVREISSFVDETSCGSGSCALGVLLHYLSPQREISIFVEQPSGVAIECSAGLNDRDEPYAVIGGIVKLKDFYQLRLSGSSETGEYIAFASP